MKYDPRTMSEAIRPVGWEVFILTGLLWWVNRTLMLFGFAIVYEERIVCRGGENIREIYNVVPARVKFRGFSPEVDDAGYRSVTHHMRLIVDALMEEAKL